jgi:hypothetical protein
MEVIQMADTWIYHKEYEAKIVNSSECEALEAEGWRDHQLKADEVQNSVVSQVSESQEEETPPRLNRGKKPYKGKR